MRRGWGAGASKGADGSKAQTHHSRRGGKGKGGSRE
jgi:hypothetical protein